jgi:hypothetical protein
MSGRNEKAVDKKPMVRLKIVWNVIEFFDGLEAGAILASDTKFVPHLARRRRRAGVVERIAALVVKRVLVTVRRDFVVVV